MIHMRRNIPVDFINIVTCDIFPLFFKFHPAPLEGRTVFPCQHLLSKPLGFNMDASDQLIILFRHTCSCLIKEWVWYLKFDRLFLLGRYFLLQPHMCDAVDGAKYLWR